MGMIAGFFFSFRAIVVLSSVNLLGTEAKTGAAISLALNFALLGAVCFDALGAGRRGLHSILRVPTLRWVAAFLALSLCSFAWSATVSVSSSLIYWCGMTADVAIVVLLLRAQPVDAVAESVMKGFIWSTCLLAAIAWVMPVQADLRLGNEEYFNTNQIGNLCAFAIFLAQYLMRRNAGKWGWVAAFLAVTLLRSLSKTTIAAFVLSQAVLLIQDKAMSRRTKVLLTVAAMLVVFAFWGLIESYYDVYTNAGNQADTLTGRVGIWATVWDAALERPWIGHGFDSMWKVIPPFGPFEARHAENEVLQQFYAYGVAGVAMLVGLYGSFYRQLRGVSNGPVRVLLMSFLLFIVVRGLAEAEPFDLLLPLWTIVLVSMVAEKLRRGSGCGFGRVLTMAAARSGLRLSRAVGHGAR